MLGRRQEINLQVYQLIDLALLAVCMWISHWIRYYCLQHFFPSLEGIPPFSAFFWVLAIVAPLTPIFLEMQGFYDGLPAKRLSQSLWQMLGCLVWIGLITGFCEVFLHWRVMSRAVLVIQVLLGGSALLFREALTKRRIQQQFRSLNRERVLLAGDAEEMERMWQNLGEEQRAEMQWVGSFDPAAEPTEKLVQSLHENSISRVIFSAKHMHFSKIEEAVQACETEGVEAWLSADFFQTAIARPSFDVLGGKLMLVFHTTPSISWSLMLKDMVDRVGALALLILSSPLWITAMVGIRMTSRGPIFFTQERSGRFGHPFRMVKFRTMHVGAEKQRDQLARENQMAGPVFKIKNDPRIFAFGRWLRRTSVDELPQLINVLRGEMSLVGPRPLPVYEVERIEKTSQRRRLSVKPGLTCLWQVSGRNKITDFEDWVALDLKYIDNWSLWLDLKILMQTLPAVVRGQGAH